MSSSSDSKCPVCDGMVRGGVLCKQHHKELADALHSLRLGIYELTCIARREVRLGGHGQGHAHPAEAPTPLDLSAADLLDQAADTLSQAAASINRYGSRPQQLVRLCIAHIGELASARDCKQTHREVTAIAAKVRQRCTPADDTIIYGPCLSDVCRRPVRAPLGAKEAQCEYCGSIWSTAALQSARRAKYRNDPTDAQGHDRTLTLTPAQAAAWVRKETNIPVNRKNVTDWLRYHRLPSSAKADGKGVWTFNPVELLDCAEGR